jgi:hypothetical protein
MLGRILSLMTKSGDGAELRAFHPFSGGVGSDASPADRFDCAVMQRAGDKSRTSFRDVAGQLSVPRITAPCPLPVGRHLSADRPGVT